MATKCPKRELRKQIANQTLKILEEGHYETPCPHSGDVEKVDISEFVNQSLNNSRCFTPKELDKMRKMSPPRNLQPGKQTELVVERITSIEACKLLWNEFKESDPEIHIGCLNFASAKIPCGGMKVGCFAQEESLGLSSTLHRSLVHFDSEYYSLNKKDTKAGFYSDTLIFTPSIAIIRDEEDDTLPFLQKEELYKVSILTCPAVDQGRVDACKNPRRLPKFTVEDAMRRRVENVLRVAADQGVQALVLGAWGCGVLKNKPEMIASLFREFLVSGPYAGVFRKVVFAMGKTNEENATAFRIMLLEA